MFIPKQFSISPTEKIFFSNGNLQYNFYYGTWRFASSQLDYIGYSNNSSKGENGWILLIRSDGSYDIDSYFAPYGCSVRLVRMSTYNKHDFNNKTVKELLDLARKSPEIINFQLQCEEISVGKRKEISQQIIDDAFESFSVIVKIVASTPDEENELYKYWELGPGIDSNE